jgi:NTP pyrophosphatase (non-canonical NTP hydrolase)
MTYRDIEMKVLQWGEARKIIPRSNSKAQAVKTLEEAGELLEAAAKLQVLRVTGYKDTPLFTETQEAYRDAVGDVLVTLIMGAALEDVDVVDCLREAYEEIKGRSGELLDNGIFKKE